MKKDSWIIRTVVSLMILVNIFLYPIGTTLTNPAKLNSIFDQIKIEEQIVQLLTSNIVREISSSSNISESLISEEVENEMISNEELRLEREKAVETFIQNLDDGEIPIFRIELSNPISSFESALQRTFSDIVYKASSESDFCKSNPKNKICLTLGGLIEGVTGKNPYSSSDQDESYFIKEDLVFESSLGVNKDNLPKVLLYYRILKYGPESLIIFSALLIFLGYAITFPNTLFAKRLFFDLIKGNFLAGAIWWVLPSVVKALNPLQFLSSVSGLEASVNDSLSEFLTLLSGASFIMPLVFLIVAMLGWLFLEVYSFVLKKRSERDVIGGYDEVEEEVSGGRSEIANRDEEEEDEDERDDDSESGYSESHEGAE